ncbi:MAG: tetratricopeptide repeat protein, partial [Deltaproteobacteria bacterium]|nr:tetratricopeptide repeat protein [Deltaproteobacteria bacterium]
MEPATDPTVSESYVALRNALLAMRDDPSAVQSVLSAVSDSGASWVQTAYCELRRDLVQGRLKQAEVMGDLIGLILEFQDVGDDELSDGKLHREGMKALVEGIGAVLAQDNLTGISGLEQLTETVYGNESLRWVAYHWMAGAAADEGDFDKALAAISEAMALADKLDEQARGSSLCRYSEIEFQRGEYDEALDHLSQATRAFEKVGDRRGMAMASMSLARMLTRLERHEEALDAAVGAQEADADWEEPVVFLSRQALIAGDVARAAELIAPFKELEPRSPEVDRQARLVEAVQQERVPVGVVVDLLRLREQTASEETVEALEVLWNEHPDFIELREVLAWSLVKVDRPDDAAGHFKEMAAQKLPPEIQSSVLLGLGCLANRQYKHRQTGARLRAASSAYSQQADDGAEEFDGPSSTREARDVDEALSESFDVDAVASDAVAQLGSLQLDEQEEEEKTPPPGVVPRSPHQPPPIPADAKRKSVEPKAVFTGDLQLFAVPDLLDFLNSSRRTGTLVITSENGIGAVHLKDGDIAGAASPNSTNVG